MYRRRGAYGVRKAAAQAQSSSTVLAIALMLFAIALALATTALAGMCDQSRRVRAFNGSMLRRGSAKAVRLCKPSLECEGLAKAGLPPNEPYDVPRSRMKEWFVVSFPFILVVLILFLASGPAQNKAKKARNTACASRRTQVWHL